jgi:UDP-N-acetylglucosamine--N-acetylmuramyl-(pentapeptide) pyrophosphoryl-undecaprenol N-acetylglucosamine transferase
MRDNSHKKIILTGGGTGGPVAPLLAITELICNLQSAICNYEFLWIGTEKGPERQMVENAGIEFRTIISGKLRRYFDWQNFVDPFKILIGFFQSIFIILKWHPDLVMSAGGFVSVPVVWAAWILRIPVIIHQQDARPGLANKLMAPFASVITVTFEKSLADYGKKAVWTGNPVRNSIINYQSSITNYFNFGNSLPVVLVVGGGTGSDFLNNIVVKSAEELSKICNIVLITGRQKLSAKSYQLKAIRCYDFLNVNEMAEALHVANVVMSRCGMNFLSELSYLGKPAILIPIPGSHQEDNAALFKKTEAALVFDQKKITPTELILNIQKLLNDEDLRNKLSGNIRQVIKTEGAGKKICGIIQRILNFNL